MGHNLKEKLLAASQLRTTVVVVDGESYIVREVGALEFSAYGSQLKTDKALATAQLLSSCIVDENGERILTVEEALQVVGSARVSMAFVNAIMDLSGFGDDDEKEPDAD